MPGRHRSDVHPPACLRWQNDGIIMYFMCLVVLAIEGIGMLAVMARLEMRMTGRTHRSGFSVRQARDTHPRSVAPSGRSAAAWPVASIESPTSG